MATTTNYSWETPDDTDLVKDGAAAIRTLGSSVDTTTKALNPSTTLGDIEYRSSTANTNTRLGIGTTGQVLTVSGGVPAWATAAGSSGPAFRAYRNGTQSVTGGVETKIQFNAENFDTDSCYDPTTNYRFTPNKAGYYQVTAVLAAISSTLVGTKIFKNGSAISAGRTPTIGDVGAVTVADLVSMNGTTDYLEVFGFCADGAATEVFGSDSNQTYFAAVWIRSN
jgi:hypothetical protein